MKSSIVMRSMFLRRSRTFIQQYTSLYPVHPNQSLFYPFSTSRMFLSYSSIRFFSSTVNTSQGQSNVKKNDTKEEQEVIEEGQEEGKPKNEKSMEDFDYDNYEDYEPRTAREQVAVYSRLLAGLTLLGIGGVGIYYTTEVLFPGRMSPFSLYSTAFETVKINDEVRKITGEPMKAYGRESSNEGRRTNIDFRQFTEDDSKRTRVRFNVRGPKGHVMVWAEISNKMAHNEYVFLICQDRRTKRVITIEDNRDRLEVEKLASASLFPSQDYSIYGKVMKMLGY